MRGIYMGNRSHDADFAMIQDALGNVANDNPGFRLRLIGALAESLPEVPSWLEIVDIPQNARNYPNFVAWLRSQCSDLDFGVAPLTNMPFNSHKSYLKILDYAAMGLPVLASDHPVYAALTRPEHMHLVNNTTADWEIALRNILKLGTPTDAERDAIRMWVMDEHPLEGSLELYDDIVLKHLIEVTDDSS
jgi:hypothetical protein